MNIWLSNAEDSVGPQRSKREVVVFLQLGLRGQGQPEQEEQKPCLNIPCPSLRLNKHLISTFCILPVSVTVLLL